MEKYQNVSEHRTVFLAVADCLKKFKRCQFRRRNVLYKKEGMYIPSKLRNPFTETRFPRRSIKGQLQWYSDANCTVETGLD